MRKYSPRAKKPYDYSLQANRERMIGEKKLPLIKAVMSIFGIGWDRVAVVPPSPKHHVRKGKH